jgi:hypothetical protein
VTVPAGVSGRDISALLRSRPGPDAPIPVLAAWLDRKADLFDRIALASGDELLTVEARALAAAARRCARDLDNTVPAAPGVSGGTRTGTDTTTLDATTSGRS